LFSASVWTPIVLGTIIAVWVTSIANDPRVMTESEIMVTLHQLKLFVSVAKSLNMTATSHEFHVSQSAVSHQIKKLERELGKTLLRRNNRPVALTAAGLALLRECEFILSKIDDLFRHDLNVAASRRKRKSLRSAPFSRRLGR
jgi:DNA-binding transcriptional LysR family regulator